MLHNLSGDMWQLCLWLSPFLCQDHDPVNQMSLMNSTYFLSILCICYTLLTNDSVDETKWNCLYADYRSSVRVASGSTLWMMVLFSIKLQSSSDSLHKLLFRGWIKQYVYISTTWFWNFWCNIRKTGWCLVYCISFLITYSIWVIFLSVPHLASICFPLWKGCSI